jgi:UPF0755 protein
MMGCALCIGLGWEIFSIPQKAQREFGQPNPHLSKTDLWVYSAQLLFHKNDLSVPLDTALPEIPFRVGAGESIYSIASRLEAEGLVRNAEAFRLYLIYSGMDYKIQAGEYRFDTSKDAIQIAQALGDSTPNEVAFNILAGWRIEEIGAAMPTSGLMISSDGLIQAAKNGSPISFISEMTPPGSLEGFLFPGSYFVSRKSSSSDLLSIFVGRFEEAMTQTMKDDFKKQGLDFYQAVILASIVEREAIMDDEQPVIASVFLNRLAVDMKLESDPTVQYAVGFNENQNTWWTNPLSNEDLQLDSPYNTYLYEKLPPNPICNPGLSALKAVASPAQTPYYFFRARCDGSGLHLFSETYEEHLNNSCP